MMIIIKRYATRACFLLASLLVIAGCGDQGGRFVTTGDESDPLLSPVGSVDIVSGREVFGSDDVSDRHLLYFLIVTPGSRQLRSGGSSDYGKYITTLKESWDTDKGLFAVSVSWDRKRDVVTIGNREFDRSAGDVFVVTVNTNGSLSGRQLPSFSAPGGARALLRYIQQQLPNDKRISSILLSNP